MIKEETGEWWRVKLGQVDEEIEEEKVEEKRQASTLSVVVNI